MRHSHTSKTQNEDSPASTVLWFLSCLQRGAEQQYDYHLGIITDWDVCYLNMFPCSESFQSTQCLLLPFIHPEVTLCTSLRSPNRHPPVAKQPQISTSAYAMCT